MKKQVLGLSLALLSLAACQPEKTDAITTAPTATASPPAAPAETPPASSGVNRETAALPAAPPAAIATQPGPAGTSADLTKTLVTGDILTVELSYRSTDQKFHTVKADLDEVSYIDDATSKKYNVLKDQEGMYMAAPLSNSKNSISGYARKEGPVIITFRFPAPPATSQTVSLNIPGTGSFNAVAVQR